MSAARLPLHRLIAAVACLAGTAGSVWSQAGASSSIPSSAEATGGSACTSTIVTHTNVDFTGGSFVTQAGFQQSEIAAASYVLPSGSFPVRVDTLEIIFGTNGATVTTTTHWSALIYRGIPSTGTLLATYSSNGGSIQHLVMPPGTNGALLRMAVDPGNPVIVSDDGSHTFSIGFRVDAHNSPPSDPCTGSPPVSSNAFPMTDVSGLHAPADNWIYGVNCGPFGCPANGGWARFSQLPFFCRPSGDWVMRAMYTPTVASSELPNVTCGDAVDNDCDGLVDCADSDCAADPACSVAAAPGTADDSGPHLAVTNPFVPGIGSIRFTLAAATGLKLDLVDVSGRLMARLAEGEYAAGPQRLTWDGRDRRGEKVPTGLLLVRLTDTQGRAVMSRLALIR
jgi:hypothetical protein